MTLQCEHQCVCKQGYLRIDEKECIAEDSPECNGLYDPFEAFKKHKYTGVLSANEPLWINWSKVNARVIYEQVANKNIVSLKVIRLFMVIIYAFEKRLPKGK